MDMNKELVRTTRKQAQLPEGAEYEEPQLFMMSLGDVAYTTGWAMWVDRDRNCWLHPNYSAHFAPGGAVSMRVERRRDGFHVWPAKGYTYQLESNPGFVCREGHDWLPVVELHYDRKNLPRHV